MWCHRDEGKVNKKCLGESDVDAVISKQVLISRSAFRLTRLQLCLFSVLVNTSLKWE